MRSSRSIKTVEEVLKEEICPRVEKYPNLPEDEFIPIEYTHKRLGSINRNQNYIYLINKKGEVWSKVTNKLMKPGNKIIKGNSSNHEYPKVRIKFENNISSSIYIHLLVASTFLRNLDPNKYTIVNHIDHNTANNSLGNLEYITKEGNSSKIAGKSKYIGEEKRVIYIGKNKEGNEIYRFTSLNIPDNLCISGVIAAIKSSKTYKECNWSKENVTKIRDNYYKTIGYSGNLEDYTWLEHPLYDNLYVCKEGYIRYKYYIGGGKIFKDEVIGGLNSFNYVIVNIINKGRRLSSVPAHRLIMEYVLKRKLKKEELVDHINTVKWDNSFSNLRLTDSKGNSNNETTVINKSIKLYVLDLFGNLVRENVVCKDFYKEVYGHEAKHASYNTRMSRSEGIVDNRFVCIDIKRLSEELVLKNLDRVLYVTDEEETKILGAFLSLEELGRSRLWKRNIKTITEYYKKGRTLDGLKILKINDAKDILIKTGNLNILNKLNQTKEKEDK